MESLLIWRLAVVCSQSFLSQLTSQRVAWEPLPGEIHEVYGGTAVGYRGWEWAQNVMANDYQVVMREWFGARGIRIPYIYPMKWGAVRSYLDFPNHLTHKSIIRFSCKAGRPTTLGCIPSFLDGQKFEILKGTKRQLPWLEVLCWLILLCSRWGQEATTIGDVAYCYCAGEEECQPYQQGAILWKIQINGLFVWRPTFL